MIADTIAALRLHNQQIAQPLHADPAAAVRQMGAMQAQDYRQALWAVGLRTQSASAATVEQAVEAGTILRTWPLRGTIHFVAAEDAGWMLQLSAARMLALDGRRQAQLELDATIIERCGQICAAALSGGKRLQRPALLQVLEDAGISTGRQRGYHIIWALAHMGVLCIGPNEGKQPTFVLLAEWAPRATSLSRDEALAELASRYLAGHAPATLHDFAWWSGLAMADARAAFAAATPGLVKEHYGGQTYWLPQSAAEPSAQGVFLLPGFDEYLLGYRERNAVLDALHAQHIVPGANGIFRPMLVVDGQILGTWKAAPKRRALDISVEPFATCPALDQRLPAAAQRYSAFLGLPLGELHVVAR